MRIPESLCNREALESLAFHARKAPDGPFVEVGVYRGGSAVVLYEIAQKQGRHLYLFDTFAGTPFADDIDSHKVGTFANTNANRIHRLFPKAFVIEGVFGEIDFSIPAPAFVHADADQYRSTKAICEAFDRPGRMVPGGMILFDDYGIRSCKGCTKAVDEAGFDNLEILPTGRALALF